MSASREKKRRREDIAKGIDPKQSKKELEKKKQRRFKTTMIAIAAVIVIAFGSLIVWNSGIIQKNATAVSIGSENYTAAEFNFYYYSLYYNYVNSYGDYLSMLGLDTSLPLNEQQYSEDQTWDDYFRESALSQMQDTIAMAKAAEKAGYALSEAQQTSIEKYTQSVKEYCTTNEITTDYYFTSAYGDNMTESIFYEQLTNSYIASEYATYVNDSYTYTSDEITAYYEENANDFDVVNYKAFLFDGSLPAETTDAGTTTDTSAPATDTPTPSEAAADVVTEAEQAALDAANASAEEMAARLTAGESFADLAAEYTPAGSTASLATEKTDAKMSSVSSVYSEWLFDKTRQSGDVTVIADAENSAYYVVVFENRRRYDYNTVNVRHILIAPEVSDGADAATDEQKAAAKAKAEEILQAWKDGEATEESFAALAEENSTDTGSNTNGGLYENVFQGEMAASFNDWIFNAARQVGDTGIVETSYGYHIIYFSGFSEPYWKIQVSDAMRSASYSAWHDELLTGYEVSTHPFGMSFTGK